MDHARAFLDAIRDEPDEDAHRLVYADWLEEHAGRGGAARAAFIRAQCRLARLPDHDPARLGLEDEVHEFLTEHGEEWTAPVRGVAEDWQFERGFIDRITVLGDAFLSQADALFAALPLRAVRLVLGKGPSAVGQVEALAVVPHLASLQALDFRGSSLRDVWLRDFLQSRYLGRLTDLNLASTRIEAPGVQALAASVLPRLTALDLSGNLGLGDRALRLLAQAPATNNLRTLRLAGLCPTAAGLQALFESPHFLRLETLDVAASLAHGSPALDFSTAVKTVASSPLLARLSSLDLGSRRLEEQGLAALASSPLVASLKSLYLRHCNLGPEGATLLADSPRLAGLRALGLSGNRIDARGMQALADSPHLAGLNALLLHGNALRDTGARALASSPHLTRLRSLNVAANAIGGPGIQALAEAASLDGLTDLDLSNNYIGPDSVRALVGWPRRLTRLGLASAGLDDECARILAAAPNLSSLRRLNLSNSSLCDAGVRALAESPHLARLEELNLASSQFGKAAAEFLAGSPYLRRLMKLNVRDGFFTDAERELLKARFGRAVEF